MQWLRFESPVYLETVRARIPLATTKIKNLITFLATASHELPVHKIISGKLSGFFCTATIIRQYLVPEIETHHAADRLTVFYNRQKFAVFTKYILKQTKIFFCKNRC